VNIFVGNLSFKANKRDAKNLCEGFGSVASVRIMMEKKGDKPRGFGFVEMPDEQQALTAIAALNGKEFMGRPLKVSPAGPKPIVEPDKGEARKNRSEITVKSRERPRPRQSRIESRRKPGAIQDEVEIECLSGHPGPGREDFRKS